MVGVTAEVDSAGSFSSMMLREIGHYSYEVYESKIVGTRFSSCQESVVTRSGRGQPMMSVLSTLVGDNAGHAFR